MIQICRHKRYTNVRQIKYEMSDVIQNEIMEN